MLVICEVRTCTFLGPFSWFHCAIIDHKERFLIYGNENTIDDILNSFRSYTNVHWLFSKVGSLYVSVQMWKDPARIRFIQLCVNRFVHLCFIWFSWWKICDVYIQPGYLVGICSPQRGLATPLILPLFVYMKICI